MISLHLPRDIFPNDHLLAFITASATGIHVSHRGGTVNTTFSCHIIEVLFSLGTAALPASSSSVHRSQLEFLRYTMLVLGFQRGATVAGGRTLAMDASSRTLTGPVVRR